MFAASRTAARTMGRAQAGAARRQLSAEAHEAAHIEVMNTWRQRTYYAVPLVGVLALANVYIHMSHHHDHHERTRFSYERKLLKKYPWSPDTCNLFDYDCVREVEAAKKGGIIKGH